MSRAQNKWGKSCLLQGEILYFEVRLIYRPCLFKKDFLRISQNLGEMGLKAGLFRVETSRADPGINVPN